MRSESQSKVYEVCVIKYVEKSYTVQLYLFFIRIKPSKKLRIAWFTNHVLFWDNNTAKQIEFSKIIFIKYYLYCVLYFFSLLTPREGHAKYINDNPFHTKTPFDMITWPCWLSIKSNIFFSLEPGSGVGKKGETKSLGRGKGSPSNLASLALSSLQPLSFCCCCFTSSLKLMKRGKNIQCQCIKLCLNNMLISLDNCRFAI